MIIVFYSYTPNLPNFSTVKGAKTIWRNVQVAHHMFVTQDDVCWWIVPGTLED